MIGNGRFQPRDPDNPQNFAEAFPLREDFCDCCGRRRSFVIAMQEVQWGYALSATEEETEGEDGYTFREFDPGCPFLALGRLRLRIRRALATRHLEERTAGHFLPLHDTLRGRISYHSENQEVAFVIDGKFLTLSQVAKMIEMYEGWQFHLDFFEEGEESR